MKLNELLDLIADSNEDDWWTISCWGAYSGPSYKNQPVFWDLIDGQKNVLKVESHSNIGVFKHDLSVTIGWGLRSNDNFQEEWANQFPDPRASSSYLDIFYNNALVFRDVYVTVDGGRASLPLPTIKWNKATSAVEALTVPLRRFRLIRLLDSLTHVSDFDRYSQTAGFEVTEEEWPKGIR